MMLSAFQILPTWLFAPHLLHQPYKKFLDIYGGLETFRYYNIKHVPNLRSGCPEMHPDGETLYHCAKFAVTHFFTQIPRCMKLYFPLQLLSLYFSRRKSLLGFVKGLSHSTLFLSTYTTLAWVSACTYYRFYPGVSLNSLRCHTWIAGIATLIERPYRRTELATYCFTYALESFYNQLIEWGYIGVYPKINLVFLAFCLSSLVYNYEQQPQIIMKFFFGLEKKKSEKDLSTH